MSDTTGWSRTEDGLEKRIGDDTFEVWKGCEGGYQLRRYGAYCATRTTLEECQILAHDTARLGVNEE